jgi:type VI secretion system protein ImpL
MSAFTNLLSKRRLAVSIGLLFLIVLTWAVGWWFFGLSATVSFVITLLILVVWIILLTVERKATERGANELEQSIKAQSEDHMMGLRPEKREEVELLRGQLAAAIESLKKSKLGKGRSGKSALYALPWYMMIGPPAAGKTTAIRNSGLEFPFGADHEIQGVGGTRNCDWWFTSSAILLDTAGRYMTEEEDKEEWLAFLDILKKHRRRQPINGVIVAVSMAELLNASSEEVDAHAKNIRRRIDELIQRLGVRFPVYLVFTKCDLLNGFVEFFEDLNRVQRHQVWGSTFSKDQLQKDNPRAAFEDEYMLLYQTLLQLRLARLGPGMKRENRRLVFAFPLQLLSAKSNLSQLVGKLFQPNPYQETPIFRGFYLTSGTQEGVPIDRVIQSIASGFGLPPEVTEQFSPEIKPKTYFIKDLFTDIVIPDERLVRLTSRAERSKRAARVGTLAAAVVALALFILAVTLTYISSRSALVDTSREMSLISQLSRSREAYDSTRMSQITGMLLTRMEKLSHPPFLSVAFQMDRSSGVLEQVRILFYREMRIFMRQNVLSALEDSLSAAGSKQGTPYDFLKCYLLLTSEVGRLRDQEAYQNFVISEVKRLLSPQMYEGMRDGLQFFVRNVAEAAAESLIAPLPENNAVVAIARTVAGAPNVENEYASLKGRVQGVQDIAISDRALSSTYAIPGLYSKAGAEVVKKLLNSEQGYSQEEAEWVLDIHDQQSLAKDNERAKRSAAIEERYFRDYVAEWWRLLGSLQIEPITDVASAADRMKRLGDPNDSPLLKVCKQVVEQTRFDVGPLQDEKDNVAAAVGVKTVKHPVDAQFEKFHQFVEGSPEQKTQSDLMVILTDLSRLGNDIEALRSSPAKNSRGYAARLVSGEESTALGSALRDMQQILNPRDPSTRETMHHLLAPALIQVARTIVGAAQNYLNEVWRTEIFDPFENLLARTYPFDPRSHYDAKFGDIAEIFSPAGRLGTFRQGEMKPFLAEGSFWETKQWEGVGIEISPAFREALKSADFFTRAFFKGNDISITFVVQIESPVVADGAQDFDRINLVIGDRECSLHWRDDKKSSPAKFEWPSAQSMRGATIRLIEEKSLLGLSHWENPVDSVAVEGDWGLFRLLSRADRTQQPGSSGVYRYCWTFRAGVAVPCLFAAGASTYDPFSSRALAIRLPDRLN